MYVDESTLNNRLTYIGLLCDDVTELWANYGHADTWDYWPLVKAAEAQLDVLYVLGLVEAEEYERRIRQIYGGTSDE